MKNSLFAKLEKASVIAFVLLLLTGLGINNAFAQNVGINTVTPNASAMLDVVSTNSGILVPRITMAQRDAIVTPATSLLIYQTDNTSGYYYNSGTPAAPVWVRLFSGTITGGEWTDAGTYLYPNENTSAQVYEDNNLYGFYYSGLAETPGYFISTEASVDNSAVYGQVDNTDWFGWGGIFVGGYAGAEGSVFPTGSNAYFGIRGTADGGTGDNYGVYGNAINGTNNYGVVGEVADATGFGVYALNSDVSGTGLIARGNNSTGNYLTGGSGVAATGTTVGVYGTATAATGIGVFGSLDVADGFGVDGRNDNAAGTGVRGVGNNAATMYSLTTGTGGAFTGADGALVYGNSTTGNGLIASGNNISTYAPLINGSGVSGYSSNIGIYGYGDATALSVGVYGASNAVDGTGVIGINTVYSDDAYGVFGQAGDGTSIANDFIGVAGFSASTNDLYGYGGYFSGEWRGIYATNPTTSSGLAGYFNGGITSTGTITGAVKSFEIDNPENPENEILTHVSIESPEAMVVYRGKIKLDENGEAIVEMPSYFVALTKENEATVQVTCIGRPFGIGYEWKNSYDSFVVYGEANREISWMVMADRDDPYMKENRKPVITIKNGDNKGYKSGYYIHPELYGQPKEKSYDYLWNSTGNKFPQVKNTSEDKKFEAISNDSDKLRENNILPELKNTKDKTTKR